MAYVNYYCKYFPLEMNIFYKCLSVQSCGLTDHILDYDIVDFPDTITVFQNLPRLICVKMYLDQIFVSCCDQTISFKMISYIICDLIFIKIFISTIDQKLRIIPISKLIILYINTMNLSHVVLLHYLSFF